MAWFDEQSVFSFGKYKGKRVHEVNDAQYIEWLHHAHFNVYFVDPVLDRLDITNREHKDAITKKYDQEDPTVPQG